MLCDNCKNEKASFHSARSVNGIMKERNLCASCQAKAFPFGTQMGSFYDVFADFTNFSSPLEPVIKKEIKKCSNCSRTILEVEKSGTLGCPNCYEAFSENLMPMILRVQNSTIHKGKSPNGQQISSATNLEIARLKKELAQAVDDEMFDEASRIKSKIIALERGFKTE